MDHRCEQRCRSAGRAPPRQRGVLAQMRQITCAGLIANGRGALSARRRRSARHAEHPMWVEPGGGPANGRNRRILLVAVHSGEGRLTEHITATQAQPPELVFVPLFGRSCPQTEAAQVSELLRRLKMHRVEPLRESLENRLEKFLSDSRNGPDCVAVGRGKSQRTTRKTASLACALHLAPAGRSFPSFVIGSPP
jgi:hypothetical protein